MGFLYHLRPDRMIGTELLPLSSLAAVDADLYDRYSAKYRDRPGARERQVEPLNCTWADCVFLAPAHPAPLCAAIRSVRPNWPKREWFEIDADRLDPTRAVLFRASLWTSEVPPTVTTDQCEPFSAAELERVSHPSPATLRRLRDPANRLPLWADVVHVLYRGSVDVSGCRILIE